MARRPALLAALLALVLLAAPVLCKKAGGSKVKELDPESESAVSGRQFFGVEVHAKKGALVKLKDADDVVVHLAQARLAVFAVAMAALAAVAWLRWNREA